MNTSKISPEYLKLQENLHEIPNYGYANNFYFGVVKELLEKIDVKSICDYGAGKRGLENNLKKIGYNGEYHPYDPVFPEYGDPVSSDLLCCIDVLEHVEIDCLDDVLDDLKNLTRRFGFFCISTRPAKKILSDGRNAHLIQAPISWWMLKICERFELESFNKIVDNKKSHGFWVIVRPKKHKVKINS